MEDDKQLSRVPRTLSDDRNADVLEKLYAVGGSIATDIITYVSSMEIKDLFGESWFSINDFCKTMGYDRTRLQRRLTEEQLRNLFGDSGHPIYRDSYGNGQEIKHPIETLFEAILFKLGNTSFSFMEAKNNGKETEYSFVQVLERFRIKADFNTNKKTKRQYLVVLNKKLRNTLFNQYNIIELKDYRNLPDRKGFRLFYLNLSKMIFLIKFKIKEAKDPYYTLTVDQLAKIFDVNIVANNDRKKKVTSILNAINDYLSFTKFNYSYVKGKNDRWAYTVQFDFSQETLEYFDERYKAVFSNQFYTAMEELYLIIVKKIPNSQTYRYLPTLKEPEVKQEFLEWLYSPEQDMDRKQKVYSDLFVKLFNKTPREYGLDFKFDFKL